jgi:hypothetical protein
VPEVNDGPKSTVTFCVPCPVAIVISPVVVQKYAVAPVTAPVLYAAPSVLAQAKVLPVTDAGTLVLPRTHCTLRVDVPQPFAACTPM